MLLIPCLLTTLLCCTVVSSRLKYLSHGFPEAVFFASFGLIFGVAPIMQSSHSYVAEFSDASRIEAAWYSLGGVITLMAGFAVFRRSDRQMDHKRREMLAWIECRETQRRLQAVFWAAIIITVGAQVMMMRVKGISVSDLIAAGRFAHRFNNQGALSVMATHLTSFIYVPAFVGVFLNRRYQILTAAYLPLASLLFYFVFAKGTRSIPLALVATALVAISLRYRINARSVVLVTMAGTLSLLLAIGLFELRQHQDSMTFVKAAQTLCSPSTYSGMWDRDPLGYGSNLVGAVETFPDGHPYLNAATYRRMFVFFLPESRFPDIKPPDTNILFGLVVHGRPEDLQVTVPPSILGDVYINFWGWWGLPVLFLHGALYCVLFRSLQTSPWAFVSLGPLIGRFLVLIHRGEPYEMFALFLVFLVLIQPVRWLCRLTKQRSLRKPLRQRRQSLSLHPRRLRAVPSKRVLPARSTKSVYSPALESTPLP
ncbi:hypothetical protein Pla108_04290 [Botrimarina colliarenosi]|uniref:Oligosaccharide repeat unit polymerase n=1 Tax=Botrimarina colliarenosi TaxID=2528001 RepID=A0A5C6AJB1_9BACT|nr:O-antigen polymerase [Botrimarina colliarenosi]TWT99490.1 hypothetical protein Pla108_04290 [Botrimarina colliarenosi]